MPVAPCLILYSLVNVATSATAVNVIAVAEIFAAVAVGAAGAFGTVLKFAFALHPVVVCVPVFVATNRALKLCVLFAVNPVNVVPA